MAHVSTVVIRYTNSASELLEYVPIPLAPSIPLDPGMSGTKYGYSLLRTCNANVGQLKRLSVDLRAVLPEQTSEQGGDGGKGRGRGRRDVMHLGHRSSNRHRQRNARVNR